MSQEGEAINADNFHKIKELLLSNDPGSRTVGLSIMEQSNIEGGQIFIVCLAKECFHKVFEEGVRLSKIEEESPKLGEFLREKFGDVTLDEISFMKVYDLVSSKDEAQFVLDIAQKDFVELIEKYNFPFKDIAEIKLIPKGYE